MGPVFFEGPITTEQVVANLPQGGVIYVQTDADLTVAWFDPNTGAYGATQAIVAPGDEVSCPSYKAKFGTATTANIRIVAGT